MPGLEAAAGGGWCTIIVLNWSVLVVATVDTGSCQWLGLQDGRTYPVSASSLLGYWGWDWASLMPEGGEGWG